MGECSFEVMVVAKVSDELLNQTSVIYNNTIVRDKVTGSTNTGLVQAIADAEKTLTVRGYRPVATSKSFSRPSLYGLDTNRVTITFSNPNPYPLTGMRFNDPLPRPLVLAGTNGNFSTTCQGMSMDVGTYTLGPGYGAAPGQLLMFSGGQIAAGQTNTPAQCTVSFDVRISDPYFPTQGVVFNSIGGTSGRLQSAEDILKTDQGIGSNVVSAQVNISSGVYVEKRFLNEVEQWVQQRTVTAAGVPQTMVIRFNNRNIEAVDPINFTDHLPKGMRVLGGLSTTCGGSITSAPAQDTSPPEEDLRSRASITLTDGRIGARTSGNNTSPAYCEISASVTVDTPGTYVNEAAPAPSGRYDLNSQYYFSRSQDTNATLVFEQEKPYSVAKSFRLAGTATSGMPRIRQTGSVVMTLAFTNTTDQAITNLALTDDLATMSNPSPNDEQRFKIDSDSFVTNTCGFTPAPVKNSTVLTLAGGTVPAASTDATGTRTNGSCIVEVTVRAWADVPVNARTNTIPADAISSSAGAYPDAVTGQVNVDRAFQLLKSFSSKQPSVNPPAIPVVEPGERVGLRLTLRKREGVEAITSGSITDSLPVGMLVANPANFVFTNREGCPADQDVRLEVPADRKSFIFHITNWPASPSASECYVDLDVLAPQEGRPADYQNQIPNTNIILNTNYGRIRNVAYANASLRVEPRSVSLSKEFDEDAVPFESSSHVLIRIDNSHAGAIPLTGVSLTDHLPDGVVVAAAAEQPNVQFRLDDGATGTCTGTINAIANSNDIVLSNAQISAEARCLIDVVVIAKRTGTFVNRIEYNTLTSDQGYSNRPATLDADVVAATLVTSAAANISIKKENPDVAIYPGIQTTYTVRVTNNSRLLTLINLPVTDEQPADMQFVEWRCEGQGGSSCAASVGSGDIDTTVSLPPNTFVEFKIDALLSKSTTLTQIQNVASIHPGDIAVTNISVDGNTSQVIHPVEQRLVDLGISKTASPTGTLIAGQNVTCTVVVSNAGPGDATGSVFTDTQTSGLSCTQPATCDATNGAQCPAQLDPVALAAGVEIPKLPKDSTLTFKMECEVR